MRKLEKKEKKMAEMMESPKRESILMGKYYSPRHIHTHRVYRFKEHLLLFPRLLTGRKKISFFFFFFLVCSYSIPACYCLVEFVTLERENPVPH